LHTFLYVTCMDQLANLARNPTCGQRSVLDALVRPGNLGNER
jgi:hypothetical protein